MKKTYVVLALFAVSCTHGDARSSKPASARSNPEASQVSSSPRSPLTVEWVVKEVRSDTTVLVARVTRHAPLRVPVQVTVTLPAGTRLVSGVTQFTIPASESPSVHDQELTIESTGHPTADVVLEADASGVDFGIHAKREYSFGVPKRDPTPTPEGPPVKLGTHDIGPAIPGK